MSAYSPMMKQAQTSEGDRYSSYERRLMVRYALLTLLMFLPLLWAFIYLRNSYPFAAWTVMVPGGSLQREWTYFVLRGETVGGETIELHPVELTDALSNCTWGMVRATVNNYSFHLRSPHPDNVRLLAAIGGVEKLPPGSRLPELLTAWGGLYNEQQPLASPQRLKAIRLDAYVWDGKAYSDYARFIQSWRQEL